MSPSAGMAAVDAGIGHALVEDQHGPFAGCHRQRDPGHGRYLAGPRARGRDHEARRDVGERSAPLVAKLRADDAVALAIETHESLIRKRLAAVGARIGDVGGDELPWLQRRVRHPECALDGGRHGRFPAQQFRGRDLLTGDAARLARDRELLCVVVRIVERGHEVAACVLDAGRRDPAQDAVLLDAFARRAWVLHDIAAAGVEQAVITTRGPGAHVALLDQQAAETAAGQIAEQTGARRPAADDEHVEGRRHAVAARCLGVRGDRSPVHFVDPPSWSRLR